MKRLLIRSAIIVAIVLQIKWSFELRHGSLPRSPETVTAANAYKANPTEATRATLSALMRQDVRRNSRNDLVLLAIMLLADSAAIYFLWNHGVKKPTA
jgi:hypothetical protein